MTDDIGKEPILEQDTPQEEVVDKKMNKKTIGLISLTGLLLCGAIVWSANRDPLRHDEVALEDFQSFPEREVVVIDQGIAEHNEALGAFIETHRGEEGLHLYEDDETDDVYAYISGDEGTEPLALMLYGIIDDSEENIVIGYNYVEASPRFQHTIPSMLLSIDAEPEADITGRLIVNEEYEHPDDVLKRYKDEGFKPLSADELNDIDEETWLEMDSADETEHVDE